jgi:hypothetical protein
MNKKSRYSMSDANNKNLQRRRVMSSHDFSNADTASSCHYRNAAENTNASTNRASVRGPCVKKPRAQKLMGDELIDGKFPIAF